MSDTALAQLLAGGTFASKTLLKLLLVYALQQRGSTITLSADLLAHLSEELGAEQPQPLLRGATLAYEVLSGALRADPTGGMLLEALLSLDETLRQAGLSAPSEEGS